MSKSIKNYNESFVKKVKTFKGNIVKHKKGYFLTSFDSITNAIMCASEVQTLLNNTQNLKLDIGISAGVPITDKNEIFEDTIRTAELLCNVEKNK